MIKTPLREYPKAVLLRVESRGRAHAHEMDKIASERTGEFSKRRFGIVSEYGALKFSGVVEIRKENRALIESVHFGNSFAVGFANRREVAFAGIFGCKDVQKRSERRRGIARIFDIADDILYAANGSSVISTPDSGYR